MSDDFESWADLLLGVAALLHRYGVTERAQFVRSTVEDRTGEVDWLTVAGLEFWGGSGAVWEAEPFEYSHPTVDSNGSDTRAFYAALLRLARELEARGLSDLSSRHVGFLRRMAGAE